MGPSVPRELLPRDSPEYARRTLHHIYYMRLLARHALRDLDAAIAEAKEARIHENWPNHRYQSVEEMIKHELGQLPVERKGAEA
jgi:hypothetical protein